MSLTYSSDSFIVASEKLDAACSWLEQVGINFSRTRIGRYKDIFSTLAKLQLEGKLDLFYENYTFEILVNAIYEVAELIRIHEGLRKYNDINLQARLQNALKGHELYVLDINDRSGRDFGFELSIAAKFCRCGYSVDFGHDADLRVQMNGYDFFVECKRLKSTQKIQKRIKEGLNQLHKRYVRSEKPNYSRGLLILSIGKTVNQNLGFIEAEDEIILSEKAFSINRDFIKKYKQYWQVNVDHRTFGVAVVLDTPGIIIKNKRIVTCHEITMNNCIPSNSKDYFTFIDIINKVFKKQINNTFNHVLDFTN